MVISCVCDFRDALDGGVSTILGRSSISISRSKSNEHAHNATQRNATGPLMPCL